MQSMKKYFSIATVITAVFVFSTMTFAQDPKKDAPKAEKAEKVEKRAGMGRFGKGKFGRMGRMGMRRGMMAHRGGAFRGLNLTDAQKEQIKAIRQANRPDKALLDEIKSIHQSRKAGTDLTPDQKARINTIRDQMRTKAQNAHDQIQNVLTAEQKAEITKRRTEMKSRREEMMKRFQERRKERQARPGDPAKPAETKKPTI